MTADSCDYDIWGADTGNQTGRCLNDDPAHRAAAHPDEATDGQTGANEQLGVYATEPIAVRGCDACSSEPGEQHGRACPAVVKRNEGHQVAAPKLLGPADEPQNSGAVVAVHYGDYRRQEIWVSSGTGVGLWFPLGGEFWAVWDRKQMPAGVTKSHPDWSDVLARGPVVLLTPAGDDGYRAGWRGGRRALWQQMEDIAEEDPR